MERNATIKTLLITLLASSCIGTVLSGCAASPPPSTPTADTSSGKNTGQSISDDTLEPAANSPNLYEQFLDNNALVTVSGIYPENEYLKPIFEKNSSYTLTELGKCVSEYFFLDPVTSYDYMQYAYVECPDSPDKDDKNLLIKFVGLDIYSQDDDSYAVFVIIEDNGQLYVTDWYQCWARSTATAYANGILGSFGSSGAGDHYEGLSVLLSNGKQTPIYAAEVLSGWWTSYVADAIYNEIFGENMESNLIVSFYTVGDAEYYQYDMDGCSDAEKALCENYIGRCRDELGINWVTEEEIQAAIKNQCNAIGIDYGITQQLEEAVWNNLP